jgi:FixJ family two-component response regulator
MKSRVGYSNEELEQRNFFNIMGTSNLQARYRQLMDKERVGTLTERDREVMDKIMDEMINRGI